MWDKHYESVMTKSEKKRLLKELESESVETVIERVEQFMLSKLPELIEGMEVSIDVSTGDDDIDNRLFGTVEECMDNNSKNNMILLVHHAEPNFKPKPFVPENWQLVPKEPNRLMLDEAQRVEEDGFYQMYVSTLSVAPKYTAHNK